MADYEYPTEAQTEIVNAFSSAFADAQDFAELQKYLQIYEKDCEKGILETMSLCVRVAKKTQINVYPVNLSALILLAEIAKKHYAEKGLPPYIFYSSF